MVTLGSNTLGCLFIYNRGDFFLYLSGALLIAAQALLGKFKFPEAVNSDSARASQTGRPEGVCKAAL